MKRKNFINLSVLLSFVWFVLMLGAILTGESFGTGATIAGIATMFAWIAAQEKIED